ncbi:hypothetical protein [Flectobacillus roseus]|uniref:hypothetical protein n=1 Tax=Flectobacillus roseus TaxID=502259 RepID=UPI0024B7BC6A|nr:hypothetical protein [Flectobacillus roseus]MDI9872318.1 hypothetical protein [Flectobacillus roseus]
MKTSIHIFDSDTREQQILNDYWTLDESNTRFIYNVREVLNKKYGLKNNELAALAREKSLCSILCSECELILAEVNTREDYRIKTTNYPSKKLVCPNCTQSSFKQSVTSILTEDELKSLEPIHQVTLEYFAKDYTFTGVYEVIFGPVVEKTQPKWSIIWNSINYLEEKGFLIVSTNDNNKKRIDVHPDIKDYFKKSTNELDLEPFNVGLNFSLQKLSKLSNSIDNFSGTTKLVNQVILPKNTELRCELVFNDDGTLSISILPV